MINKSSTLEKLAAYNYWANDRLLQHLENMPGEIPETSLQLFSHVINAQVIWLSRLENIPVLLPLFETHTLNQCRELHETTSEQFQEYATLNVPELETEVIYTNTKGEGFSTSIHDILMQVFNHGTYHRAQVARDLRQHNLEPINTDYITYVRSK
ncbi:MAG: DinB family protein [Adhaeribacter sp.]